jgi:hypothetical protein
MTACTANFRISIPATAASIAPIARTDEVRAARPDRLVTRLAARISAALDEIAPFATNDLAEKALVDRFARNRRIGLALAADSTLGARARSVARSTSALPLEQLAGGAPCAPRTLDALIALANEVDTLFLEAPIVATDGGADEDRSRIDAPGRTVRWLSPLAPRELLELRARAPRATLILDLRREDFARTPLTQSALLIPGTLILRGFGDLWAAQGATTLAPTAFVAGPARLVETLAETLAETLVETPVETLEETRAGTRVETSEAEAPLTNLAELEDRLVAELDAPELERRVQSAARALRAG